MTEKDKRDQGLWYDANFDNELLAERLEAEGTIFELNHPHPCEAARKRELLEGLLGSMGKDVEILMPFNVDYGYNVHVGDGTFINHRAYLMDCAPITIGSHVFIGPRAACTRLSTRLLWRSATRGWNARCPLRLRTTYSLVRT